MKISKQGRWMAGCALALYSMSVTHATALSLAGTLTRTGLLPGLTCRMASLVNAAPTKVVSLTLDMTSALEGTTALGTVTLDSPAPLGGTKITLFSANHYVVVPASVTVQAGLTSAQFPVETLQCDSVNVIAVTAFFNQTQQTATLTENPILLLSVAATPPTVKGGKTTNLIVTLNGAIPTRFTNPTYCLVRASNYTPIRVNFNGVVPKGVTQFAIPITTVPVRQGALITFKVSLYYGTLVSTTLTVIP